MSFLLGSSRDRGTFFQCELQIWPIVHLVALRGILNVREISSRQWGKGSVSKLIYTIHPDAAHARNSASCQSRVQHNNTILGDFKHSRASADHFFCVSLCKSQRGPGPNGEKGFNAYVLSTHHEYQGHVLKRTCKLHDCPFW